MTAELKANPNGFACYKVYRESGVEWLSEVPEHWEVKRLKFLASTNDEVLSEGEDALRPVLYVDIGSVNENGEIPQMEEMVFKDAPSRARRLVRDGDTIISTVRTYLRAISPICDPPDSMVVSTGFAVIRPRNLDPAFASWGLREHGFVEEVVARSTGVSYPAINAWQVGELPIPHPPLSEQRAIAKFLEQDIVQIDALITKKLVLTERLQEYRTALITHTVTHGLPPDAARAVGLASMTRLKPSGVECIGEVPEHWEIKRLKYVAKYYASSVDKKTEDGEVPVRLCNYTDVYYRDRIQADIGDFMEATASQHEVSLFKLQGGDTLITKDSEDWRDIAVPALIDKSADDFLCGYHLGIIRSSPAVDPAFLFRSMQSVAVNQQLQRSALGVTRYGLSNSAVSNILLTLPPLHEQRVIARFLNQATERIDNLIKNIQLLVERLREYRTSLVRAAVTGKIDVRQPAGQYVPRVDIP